jgi:hypothetical protein
MFENESASVARKARSKSRGSTSSPEPNPGKDVFNRGLFEAGDGGSMTDIIVRSSRAIAPSPEEKGCSYFYSNYAVNPTSVAALSIGSEPASATLSACISALGLAGLSTMLNDHHVLREARRLYITAIRLINNVLSFPELAKKDSTILSVLVLSGFETVSGSDRQSLTAWSNHVHGAGALIKLRGPGQLKTITGRQIFGHVSFSLLTTCLHQEIPLPEYIFKLRAEAYQYLPPAAHRNWSVLDSMLEFADFSGKVKRGEITDHAEIMRRGMEVDNRFQNLVRTAPESWQFQTTYTNADDDLILLGYYHVYEGHWATQMWNGIRSMRIILMHHMLNSVTKAWPISAERDAKEEVFTYTLKQSLRDIVASIPFQLGYKNSCSPYDFPKEWLRVPDKSEQGDMTSSLVPLIRSKLPAFSPSKKLILILSASVWGL